MLWILVWISNAFFSNHLRPFFLIKKSHEIRTEIRTEIHMEIHIDHPAVFGGFVLAAAVAAVVSATTAIDFGSSLDHLGDILGPAPPDVGHSWSHFGKAGHRQFTNMIDLVCSLALCGLVFQGAKQNQ